MNSIFRYALILAVVGLVWPAGSLAQPDFDSAFMGITVPTFDRPVDPDRYLIRPGERLEVVFLRSKLPGLVLKVDYEGNVVNRDLGRIALAGKSLTEARRLLLEPLRELYTAEEIVITVGSVYPVIIQVDGLVNRPGRYTGFTSQRVSELIDSAGGLAPGGSDRRIRLLGGPEELEVDLALARVTDSSSLDPCLYAGRRLVVPEMQEVPVVISGAVVNSGPFELKSGEGLDRLIQLAGGLRSRAEVDRAVAVNERGRDIRQPNGIKPGDNIWIPWEGMEDGDGGVIVTGAANRVGRDITLGDDTTLKALITALGGVQPLANEDRVAVFRLAVDPQYETPTGERYPIWVGDMSAGEVILQPNDSIHVPRRVDHVRVTGDVTRPGRYPYRKGRTVDQYVTMAGGMTQRDGNVEYELYDRVAGLTRQVGPGAVVYDGDRITVKISSDNQP